MLAKSPTIAGVRKRRATQSDVDIGRRIRLRRLEKRMSQTALADKVGVTFQQIQKNEKGVNRVSAARLQQMSEILEVPVAYFFGEIVNGGGGGDDGIIDLLQTSRNVRMMKAFDQIKSRKQQELLLKMAEEMAGLTEAA